VQDPNFGSFSGSSLELECHIVCASPKATAARVRCCLGLVTIQFVFQTAEHWRKDQPRVVRTFRRALKLSCQEWSLVLYSWFWRNTRRSTYDLEIGLKPFQSPRKISRETKSGRTGSPGGHLPRLAWYLKSLSLEHHFALKYYGRLEMRHEIPMAIMSNITSPARVSQPEAPIDASRISSHQASNQGSDQAWPELRLPRL
jgi:hypothetical protein